MDIQKVIEHARDVAKEKYVEGMLCHANPDDDHLDACIECAREHEQLAEWLEELQQYKQLGTLEEVREAVGFRKAKKPILSKIPYKKFGREEEITGIYCKTCGSYITNFTEAEIFGFCKTCGQAIDWSDEDD